MVDRPRVSLPWMLVAASVIFAALFGYLMFGAYLPVRHRVASLEAELKELYRREAELQTRLSQQEQRHAVREQQVAALTGERDALVRRLEDLERELARSRRR